MPVKKTVIVDTKNALLIIGGETRKKITVEETAIEAKISSQNIRNWNKSATTSVKYIAYMLKKYPFLSFWDLVK